MATDVEQRIDELACAVADRSPVEWEKELCSTESDEERTLILQLQNVERIVEAHWGLSSVPARLGDFEIIREIGRGAMGVVYEARQVSLDRRVAIKVLSAEMTTDAVALERLDREARALASLNHPNNVTIHSVEHIDGVHFITMELVEGQSLANLIPERGMPIKRLLEIAVPLADALSSAHEHEIIHRDLKPANIMINDEGRVKILDFGLAKFRRPHRIVPDARTLTVDFSASREGGLVGTIPYMSPEQAECGEVDHRSDLFSLGVVIYEMVTGRRPFRGLAPAAVISSILQDHPMPVTDVNPDLDADLDRIIRHCLRKNPERRYQTAKGLRNELEELAMKLQAGEYNPIPRPRWVLWTSFSAALLLVIGLTFVAGRWIPTGDESAAARYLAVLPFTPLGEGVGDKSTTAISDGLAEILTTKLTQLTDTQDLQVAPAGLVSDLPASSVEAVGESLGVNLAIAGSMLRSGDNVRVTVNLVDVREQRQLQAQVINADLGDPFAFQDRIVGAVVEMLELELPISEEELLRFHGTTVATAHRLYIEGRGHMRNFDQVEHVDGAIRTFEQALVADPEFAQAHAALGMAYWKRFDHDPDPRWVDRASESCERSVTLDDRLAEGHACLGTVYSKTGRPGEAAAEFGWAISRDPTLDDAFSGLADVYGDLGDPEAAEEVYRKAINNRPHYWAGYSRLGGFYFYQGRYAESEEMFLRTTELTPESYRAHSNLGGSYLLQGKFAESIPVFERSIELKPNADAYSNLGTAHFKLQSYDEAVLAFQKAVGLLSNDYGLWGNLAESYHWSGEEDKAAQAYRRAVDVTHAWLQVNPRDPDVLGELAKYHAMLGDREEAVEYLERTLLLAPADAELKVGAAVIYSQLGETDTALDWLEKALGGGVSVAYVKDTPEFENLRGQKRFKELLADSEESPAD